MNIGNAEPANDTLAINALAGNDVVDASALAGDAIKLALDGGAGNDVLHRRRRATTCSTAGPGVDVLDGGPGNDVLIQD